MNECMNEFAYHQQIYWKSLSTDLGMTLDLTLTLTTERDRRVVKI
jgi:hypothetical protein